MKKKTEKKGKVISGLRVHVDGSVKRYGKVIIDTREADLSNAGKLPSSLKKKWVAALRSGKYRKGKGQLKLNGRYCCLGVLADVQGRLKKSPITELWEDGDEDERLAQSNPATKHISSTGILPSWCITVSKKPGLEVNDLTVLNDDSKATFCEIAWVIEELL